MINQSVFTFSDLESRQAISAPHEAWEVSILVIEVLPTPDIALSLVVVSPSFLRSIFNR